MAASLGAPFWFDLLDRFMVVRSTLKPPQTDAADTLSALPGSERNQNFIRASRGLLPPASTRSDVQHREDAPAKDAAPAASVDGPVPRHDEESGTPASTGTPPSS